MRRIGQRRAGLAQGRYSQFRRTDPSINPSFPLCSHPLVGQRGQHKKKMGSEKEEDKKRKEIAEKCKGNGTILIL